MINIQTEFRHGEFRELIISFPGVKVGTGYIPSCFPGILRSTVKAWTEVRYKTHTKVLQAGHNPVTYVK